MSGETVVVDLRGRAVRFVQRCWERWEESPPPWLRPALGVTEPLRRRIQARRLADRGTAPPGPLIVSVGNLAVGGTGKTPVTIALARRLRADGLPVAIVTRGHGASHPGPLRVDPDDPRCGDEARMMAGVLPGVPVVQGRDRTAALRLAGDDCPGGVVLVEDGFQAAVPRHLDLLLLDRWEVADGRLRPGTGLPLPWGPYRETAAAAARATAWLLPLAPGQAPPAAAAPVPVHGFRTRTFLVPGVAPPPGEPYGIIAGIARPERLLAACRQLTGRPPRAAVWCDDHVRYGASHLRRLAAVSRRHGIEHWLTTTKDAVKLLPLWELQEPPGVIDLEVTWVDGAGPATEILSLARSGTR